MPFRSEAQRRFMYAQHPDIAKRWEDTYGSGGNLPEHVGSGAKRKLAHRMVKKRRHRKRK